MKEKVLETRRECRCPCHLGKAVFEIKALDKGYYVQPLYGENELSYLDGIGFRAADVTELFKSLTELLVDLVKAGRPNLKIHCIGVKAKTVQTIRQLLRLYEI